MASTQLQRTAVTSTENYKYTFSAWIKRGGKLGSSSLNEVLFSNWSDNNNSAYIRFEDQNDNLHVFDKYGSTIDLNYQTNMKFRDCNGWFHIVVNVDGSRSANQRCKIYVNGSEVSCSNTTDTGGTLAMKTVTTTNAMRLGAIRTSSGAEYYFSGLMSHVHYIDGTGYDASYFGETDSTTGEWKINTSPSVTYGTNGFFILKDGNSVTDASPNTNNFTVGGGTLTKTEDCPSNVFATLNPLVRNQTTNSYGNLRTVSGSTSWMGLPATLGVDSGKFYWEYKLTVGNAWSQCGVMSSKPNGGYDAIYSTYVGNNSGGLALNSGNGDFYHDGSSGAYGTSAWFSGGLAQGDIIGVALDATNSKIWFAKNGTWGNSSNPSTNSGAIDFSGDTDFTNYKPYLPAFSVHNCTVDINFGNGYFGTTAVSSAGTNASGIGLFEYDVPTGYTALSTKGLNL